MPFEGVGGQPFLFPNPAGFDHVIMQRHGNCLISLWLSYNIFGTLEMHFFLLLISDDHDYGTAT